MISRRGASGDDVRTCAQSMASRSTGWPAGTGWHVPGSEAPPWMTDPVPFIDRSDQKLLWRATLLANDAHDPMLYGACSTCVRFGLTTTFASGHRSARSTAAGEITIQIGSAPPSMRRRTACAASGIPSTSTRALGCPSRELTPAASTISNITPLPMAMHRRRWVASTRRRMHQPVRMRP